MLQPNLKTFVWRLLWQALTTGERVRKYSTCIDKNCKLCNILKTDSHLFFQYPFARTVWFAWETPVRADALPTGQQGVQAQLAQLLPPTVTPSRIQEVLTTLWHIWKVRNGHCFDRQDYFIGYLNDKGRHQPPQKLHWQRQWGTKTSVDNGYA